MLASRQREKPNARQIFAAMKHVEMIQIQPCQAAIEISASRNNELDTGGADGGSVIDRTGKRGCAALRHRPVSGDARRHCEAQSLKSAG